jgi:integral membrane sensor domain MASE1
MLTKHLTKFFTGIYHNPWGRVIVLSIYYLAIIVGLILLYGKGQLASSDFVYQGF